jgi:hypothetical protein
MTARRFGAGPSPLVIMVLLDNLFENRPATAATRPSTRPLRRECVDRMLIFGEAHLAKILSSYAAVLQSGAHALGLK